MYEYRQVAVDNEGIQICSSFLRHVFPLSNNFTESYLRWEYADNPEGTVVGFNAFEGDVLVAHYASQPITVNLFGKQTKGLLSLNTGTHHDHRGKKLFTILAELTYKYAAENGYEFVLGVANANSTPGFIKNLGFQFVSPLDVKLGIGFVAQKEVKEQYCFNRIWTKELLEWRLKNPQREYEILGEHIYAATRKYGIKATIGKFDEKLLNDISSSKIFTINPLKLFVGLDSNINWKKSMYFDVPEKIKSSPLNLIYKDISGDHQRIDRNSIKFQVIDFDGY